MKRVIVGDAGCLTAPDGQAALPGALEAVAHLNQAGFTVIAASDIPALATDGQAMAAANARYARLQQALGAMGGRIDAVFFCSALPGAFDTAFAGLLRDVALRYQEPPGDLQAIFAGSGEARAALAAGVVLHRLERAARTAGDPPLPTNGAAYPDLASCAQALVAAADRSSEPSERNDTQAP
ncbi:MAG: hypothetical protein EPN34_04130 [Burkholderiaceae bacterium]|nr:MAG: hypothetical protein EPN34_04130 [Burkholderiaceae bacterium]